MLNLAILLGLQIIGNFLVCVGSGYKWGYDDEKIQLSEQEKRDLLVLYDKAKFEDSNDRIPDPRCHFPFSLKGDDLPKWTQNQNCINDRANSWCSQVISKSHPPAKGKWRSCLMKGAEVADPKKWKPHKDCVPIFAYYNPKHGQSMYYKGCSNIEQDKPWCAHDYGFKTGKWSFCINIEIKWSEWILKEPCFGPCGGHQSRFRVCQQTGKPSSGCPGSVTIKNTPCPPCPINGGWSNWGHYGTCSVTCGSGTKTRTRECNNPEPQYGGKDCGKDKEMMEPCKLAKCPLNGGWSEWSTYGDCSVTCGSGMKTRTRECNNPEPEIGGKDCGKENKSNDPCKLDDCPAKTSKMSNTKSTIIYVVASICCVVLVGIVATVLILQNKNKIGYVNEEGNYSTDKN